VVAHELVAHIDFPLLLITAGDHGVGLATVYSATYDSAHRMMSQAGNMGIALVVMWFVSRLPPQKLMGFAIPLYIVGLLLLVAVFLFGIKVNGAKRWLSLGFTRIQPSEIMKIAMPLMLAWYFHKYEATLRASITSSPPSCWSCPSASSPSSPTSARLCWSAAPAFS
jgi:rod shape determining protein RodA